MTSLVATLLAATAALTGDAPKRPCPPTEEISYADASRCIGEVRRVVGRLDHVSRSKGGVLFLNFCPDWRSCPFGAVVFREHLQHFTEVASHAGREIEVSGRIGEYKGKPQIVLETATQLLVRAPLKPPQVVPAPEEPLGHALTPVAVPEPARPQRVERVPVWHAAAHVGRRARIVGTVGDVVPSGNDLVVRFAEDNGPSNFVAVVLEPNVAALAESVQEWPGRDVELEGEVTLFDGRPAIFVSERGQVTLVGRARTGR